MGWFDEQIRQRKAADNDALSETFDKMTGFSICTLPDCPRTADIAAYTACLSEFRRAANKSQP